MQLILSRVFIILTLTAANATFAQKSDEDHFAEEIYNADTIVWFGADFSLFKLSNPKKSDKDDELSNYVLAWNEEYKKGLSNVKIAQLLKKKKVINDREHTDEVIKEFDYGNWIVTEKHTITIDDIADELSSYASSNKGIGLVYFIENFYKTDPGQLNGYFVWFDIKTKNVIDYYYSKGQPSTVHFSGPELTIYSLNKLTPKTKGMVGYWYRGMIDSTVEFVLEYVEGIKKEEPKY